MALSFPSKRKAGAQPAFSSPIKATIRAVTGHFRLSRFTESISIRPLNVGKRTIFDQIQKLAFLAKAK